MRRKRCRYSFRHDPARAFLRTHGLKTFVTAVHSRVPQQVFFVFDGCVLLRFAIMPG